MLSSSDDLPLWLLLRATDRMQQHVQQPGEEIPLAMILSSFVRTCPPIPVNVLRSSLKIQRRLLSLAFTLHEPPAISKDARQAPLIILHGLFGSKQNNRSISK